MDMEKIISRAENNIRQAIADYRRHTDERAVLDDISDSFIHNLARDSSYAKQPLRELFSKSPVWNEELDALVINGTRTHNPDYDRIRRLAETILYEPMYCSGRGYARYVLFKRAIDFFANPDLSDEDKQNSINAINQLAPKAYTPTKKPSRVFKALCVALGVADETTGSEFQRLYAQFADELSAKKISFKLFVSINPAHFLTMSNPKWDTRGNTLTSCHSLNSTEYSYNNGCSGYARDSTSFIVFTVDDPAKPETFNNRKTSRQIFAYRPESGLLMQSRMYNTQGGVYGAAADSKLYRDLVQREISALEGIPNLWNTVSSTGIRGCNKVYIGDGFGGYTDWTYSDFDGHISFRCDCDESMVDPLEVGAYGLCIVCGCECSTGLYCEDCDHGSYHCDDCEGYVDDEDDLHTVYGRDGDERYVCDNCRDDYYICCNVCEEYHCEVCMTEIDGCWYCDSCRDKYCEECEECGEWHCREDMRQAYKHGREVWVCDEDCIDNYVYCEDCDVLVHINDIVDIYLANGTKRALCEDCAKEYIRCPVCDNLIEISVGGTCPACGTVIEKNEEESA